MSSTPALECEEKTAPAPGKAPPRSSLGDGFAWALTDHCCRACFSRVLVRETFDRRRIYRCAGCGIEREGRAESSICCCGMKLKTGVDAGLRCGANPDRSPEFPAEIVAAQIEPSTGK